MTVLSRIRPAHRSQRPRGAHRRGIARLLALLALLGTLLHAQMATARCPLVVREGTGKLVARIGARGDVRSPSGRLLGTVDGTLVRNREGSLLGSLDGSGVGRGSDGRMLAQLGPRGELHDPTGKLLLRIDAQGTIRTPQGKLRGRIDGSTPRCHPVAVAYLVFFGRL